MFDDINIGELLKMKFILNENSNIYIIIFTLFISNIIKYIYYPDSLLYVKESYYKMKLFFFKHNKIIIEGKRAFKNGPFSMNNENIFSDTFNALWYKVNLNLDNYKDVCSIKECHERSCLYDEYGNKNNHVKTNCNIFIVNQANAFKLEENIYCNVSFNYEQIELDRNKNNAKVENIKISIYSYSLSIKELKSYINKVTDNYKKSLNNSREDKIFIYTYQGDTNNYDSFDKSQGGRLCGPWQECIFNTTTNFENKFFQNKEMLLNKLDFFTSQKEWYNYQGIPYSLGIGLSGPPGTGKTSIIKSIANRLQRHIIIIPLNKIATENEFYNVFYESRYNKSNEVNSIGFDKKIIVFEDIDCMSDIVYDRDASIIKDNIDGEETKEKGKNDVELISSVIKACKDDDYDGFKNYNKQSENKLTLSFILNIIDGIRETPGRILIITSNYYDKLDKALIRPGRIDISLEMKLATIDIIEQMFNHFYSYDKQQILFYDILKRSKYNKRQLQDYKITQAEIVKCYHDSPKVFMDNIMAHMC